MNASSLSFVYREKSIIAGRFLHRYTEFNERWRRKKAARPRSLSRGCIRASRVHASGSMSCAVA